MTQDRELRELDQFRQLAKNRIRVIWIIGEIRGQKIFVRLPRTTNCAN